MSILNNKRTLIVCQLLLSTLAFGLLQVGRLSTWNIAITCMTNSILCVFIFSYFRCLGYIQLLRLVVILSYLAMPVNLVQYRGATGVFNNRKFHNKTVGNKFYSSLCGFNAELAVLAPFSIHQIILLLLTTLMWMSKDNFVQSIKRLCILLSLQVYILYYLYGFVVF